MALAEDAQKAGMAGVLLAPVSYQALTGDPVGALGLSAGCQAWYSVLGGLFPEKALAITRAAQAGDTQMALKLSSELEPLWALYREYGSLRVIATVAEVLGDVSSPSLPMPLKTLQDGARKQVEQAIEQLEGQKLL